MKVTVIKDVFGGIDVNNIWVLREPDEA